MRSLFERPRVGERALLVHLFLPQDKDQEDIREFEELARSAGAGVLGVVTATRSSPHPKYFVGTGKAGEIRERVEAEGAELVLFNHALSPSQERNLEQLLKCRVLDRTGLILDIFAQRARSHEGKLQVELAQLRHLSTRLVRGWTHLERQKGGIGLRGPGETQLETDRRLLGERIKQLGRRLEKVQRQRAQGRRARTRAEVPTVSLVGYTNAGKSTLFNALTTAEVYAADQLFATLDPTLRRVELPGLGEALLADTVGFIRHLPHDLVAAFRSTLEETREADLLLHVVEVHDESSRERIQEVDAVLAEIEAGEVPQLRIYNKIDLAGLSPRLERDSDGRPRAVWVSAQTGAGLELVREALAKRLSSGIVRGWVRLPPEAGRARAEFFQRNAVLREETDADGISWLLIRMPLEDHRRLCARAGLPEVLYPEPDRADLASVSHGP